MLVGSRHVIALIGRLIVDVTGECFPVAEGAELRLPFIGSTPPLLDDIEVRQHGGFFFEGAIENLAVATIQHIWIRRRGHLSHETISLLGAWGKEAEPLPLRSVHVRYVGRPLNTWSVDMHSR